MKIGISVLTHAGQSIWQNGIGQNVFHLADLLSELPFVEAVYLIDCGDQGVIAPDAPAFVRRYPIVTLPNAADLVDVAIEMQGGLPVEWLDRLRARGGRAVYHACGQPYAALVEPTVFGGAGYFVRPDRCDEVWLLPQYAPWTPMLRTLHRCPVRIVPYLWSPSFLDGFAEKDAEDDPAAPRFGYEAEEPGQGGSASAAIFEPNISIMKTGFLPVMACEEAERLSPGLLSRVTLYNGLAFKDHTTFRFMTEQLEIARSGVLILGGREFFSRAVRGSRTIVVSHQLENPQNYLYLDALHGGYPVVHNSEFFRDAGYYYPGSDIGAAARQIVRARFEHDLWLDAYRRAGNAAIERLSPRGGANRQTYARLLLGLVGGGA